MGTCPVCGSVGKGVARLNARCRFVDFADSAWMTTFHEGAESLFGSAASDVHSLENRADGVGTAVDDVLKQRYYRSAPYELTIRAKTDLYQGEARCNISCINARPVQRGEHGRRMLSEIREMLAT